MHSSYETLQTDSAIEAAVTVAARQTSAVPLPDYVSARRLMMGPLRFHRW